MATHDSLNLALPPLATFRLYGDLQRFGRRFDLSVSTAAEGLHALFLQLPQLRQCIRDGWYQIRIAGSDVTPDEIHQRFNEKLPRNAVIHIVPRIEGARSGAVFQFIAGAAVLGLGWWNPGNWAIGGALINGDAYISLIDGSGMPKTIKMIGYPAGNQIIPEAIPEGIALHSVWALTRPSLPVGCSVPFRWQIMVMAHSPSRLFSMHLKKRRLLIKVLYLSQNRTHQPVVLSRRLKT